MEPEAFPANSVRGVQPEAPHSVERQLAKILASPSFSNSARLSRFLRYTVEQSMNGRSHELKEYLLGLDVFDRPESFDPRTDSVVRVEAGRLRAKLRQYYDGEGRDDQLVIDLPKGHYAPTFTMRDNGHHQGRRNEARSYSFYTWILTAALVVLSLMWVHGLAFTSRPAPLSNLAVLPFEDLSAGRTNRAFLDGLVDELTNSLSNVQGLQVASRASVSRFKVKAQDLAEIGRRLRVGSVVQGRIRNTGSRVRVKVELIGINDGHYLWSEIFERDLEDAERVFEIQNDIASAITRALTPRLLADWPKRRIVARPGRSLIPELD